MSETEKAALVGQAVSERRGQAVPTPESRDGLTIAIGTAPQGLSLAAEARLSKAALLYADRVVLYSPTAVLLASAEQLGELDEVGLVSFLRQVAPSLGDQKVLDACDLYERLKDKKHRTREEIVMVGRFGAMARDAASGFAQAAEILLRDAGADDIEPALRAGLLQIDPIVTPEASEFPDAYLSKLEELVSRTDVYPLFDDETGDLVRAHVAEGLFKISPDAERRGKQVAAAAGFIGRMPALPRASMEEVLDVRNELVDPLRRFRVSMIRLGRLIESSIVSEELGGELQDVYDSEVAPALEEIAEAFVVNAYLKELLGAGIEDMRSLLAYGAGLFVGVADPAHLPAIASAAIGAGVAALPLVTQAGSRVKARRDRAERDHMYFLYRANEQLGRRAERAGAQA